MINLKFKKKGATHKFLPKWVGPFKVLKLVGPRTLKRTWFEVLLQNS